MSRDPLSLVRAAARLARERLDTALDGWIEKQTGLQPIDRTRPEDVFICGYPKSGNTWLQHMTTAALFGVNVEIVSDTLMNELVPDIHFKRYYRRFSNPCVFKSHHLPRPAYRRVVYLIRDGRDVMVSYFHHLNATAGTADFLRMVQRGDGLSFGKWHDHVEAYLSNPYNAELMIIRYEDLKRDALGQLKRLCSFAGIERDEATLAAAVEVTSFDRMKKKEQRLGWETPGWPKDKPFVRRGQSGSYRDEMPADVLTSFLREAGATLVKQGYAGTQDLEGGL